MSAITGVLLAAGSGRRFGGNKLLHPLDDGVPLALHSARALKAALPQSVVVVDINNRELCARMESEGLTVAHNGHPERGMGYSIACGVKAQTDAEGWVIALADMPWLKAQTILSVADGLREASSICAPRYRGVRGHPVGFGKDYVAALTRLNGDEGARGIIAANRDELILFDTGDEGAIRDVDYPRDLYSFGDEMLQDNT